MAAKKEPSFGLGMYETPASLQVFVRNASNGKVSIHRIPPTETFRLICGLCMQQVTVEQTPYYLDSIEQFCHSHQHPARVRHQMAEEQQQSIRETGMDFGGSFKVQTNQPMVTFTEDQLRSIHKMSNCNVSVQARRKSTGSLEGRACCQECKAECYFDPTLVAQNNGQAWSELGVFLDKHRHSGSASYVTGTRTEVRVHRKFRFSE